MTNISGRKLVEASVIYEDRKAMKDGMPLRREDLEMIAQAGIEPLTWSKKVGEAWLDPETGELEFIYTNLIFQALNLQIQTGSPQRVELMLGKKNQDSPGSPAAMFAIGLYVAESNYGRRGTFKPAINLTKDKGVGAE